MSGADQQDETLSTLLVKEAVSMGLDSPMRDPILEAVEETEGTATMGKKSIPLAGGLLGLGVAIGYLVGSESADAERTPLSKVEESVEEFSAVPEEAESEGDTEPDEPDESEAEDAGGSSRLKRAGVVLVTIAGIELLRRRRKSGEDTEWEPIEEFEPATDATFGDEEDDETEGESGSDEATSDDETVEE